MTEYDQDIKKVDEINNKVWIQLGNNIEQEITDAKSARDLALKIDYPKGVAFSYLNLGYCFYYQDDYEKALSEFQNAMLLYQEVEDKEGELRCLTAFGNFYKKLNVLDQSLDYRVNALSLAETLGDDSKMAVAYINLGDLNFIRKDFQEALRYNLKAVELIGDDHVNHSAVLCNIARTYIALKDYNKPLPYLEKGLALVEAHDLKYYRTHLLIALGILYKHQENYEKAADIFFEAKTHAETFGHNRSLIEILFNLGNLFYQTKAYNKSYQYLFEASDLAERLKISEHLVDIYQLLYQVFKKEGKFNEALENLEKLRNIENRKYHEGLNEKLSVLTAKYKHKEAIQEKEIYQLKNVELKESYQRLTLLSSIGRRITANLELNSIIEEVYQGINSLMDATVFGLGLVDKGKKYIEYKYFREDHKTYIPQKVSLSDKNSFFASCIASNREIIINDFNPPENQALILSDPSKSENIPKSLVFIPLNSDQQAIGGITVQCYQSSQYNDQHIEMLRILGSYIVSAVQNAIAYEEVNKLLDLLSKEKKELLEANQKIKHLANHDVLTNLPNRRLFMTLVDYQIENCKRNNGSFALHYLDLDNFKPINDQFGHQIGDIVLKTFSDRMCKMLRKSDVVARVGGDEFIILQSDVKNQDDCELVAQKIIQHTSEVMTINENDHQIGVSIGISIYPNHGLDASSLIKKADNAMYQSKHTSKNTYHFSQSSSESA